MVGVGRAMLAALCRLCMAGVLLTLAGPGVGAAQTPLQAPEHRVKATFIYKFGEYLNWPAGTFSDPDSPLIIGVLEAAGVAEELARLVAGRTMAGQPVQVRSLQPQDPLGDVHLLFVGAAVSTAELEAISALTGDRAVLIVTESPRGPEAASAINFVVVEEKVRFEVALAPAEARGIRISSRLLAVARSVQKGSP